MNERKKIRIKTRLKDLENKIGLIVCEMQVRIYEDTDNTLCFEYLVVSLQHYLMEYLELFNELKYANEKY